MFLTRDRQYSRCLSPTVIGFLVGSKGQWTMVLVFGYASGGKFVYGIFGWGGTLHAVLCQLRSHDKGGFVVCHLGGEPLRFLPELFHDD